MCDRVEDLASAFRSAVSALDASTLSGSDAARLVEVFADIERLGVAGRTLAAGRVVETGEWRGSAHRTPAHWIAARTKGTVAHAISTLQTAHHLNRLSATREAFAAGQISDVQASEISAAAAADPGSETALLRVAAEETVSALREECRTVRAAATGDEEAAERIRRGRYLRNWIDRDGAVRLDARLAPDDGARLLATVEAGAARLRRESKRSGLREPAEAYAADALVALADGDRRETKAVVHVQVDASAFERGRVAPGETCRIRGIGPIPVSTRGVSHRTASSR